MWTAITGLLGSKKFWVTIVWGAIQSAESYAGVSQQTQLTVAGIVGVLLAAMGMADFGKASATPKGYTAKDGATQ